MNRRRELLLGLVCQSALSCLGSACASVPDTVCRLQSQIRLDPAMLVRKTISGNLESPVTIFWNIEKK